MRKVATKLFMCASLSLLGCGESKPAAPAPAPAPAPAAQPTPAPVAEAPKPSVEDSGFRLALESAPSYPAGQPAQLKLVLEARGGYHVNQDYPIRVSFKAPAGVKLTKDSLGKADAAQFGEESARFDVGFSADKGSHELLADVDFAVCTKDTCVPDQRKLAVALNVQ